MLTQPNQSVVSDKKTYYVYSSVYLNCCFLILAIYVGAGAFSPRLLAWLDLIVTPRLML
jgi:hypothetical protein